MADELVKEYQVDGWPGWTRIVRGTTRRYRSPSGVEISGSKFYKLSNKYLSGGTGIPEFELVDDNPGGFFQQFGIGSQSKKRAKTTETETGQETETENILNLPEAKPKTTKSSGGKSSAKELAFSIQTTLVIITSVIALLLEFPDMNMNDMEVNAISVPLANILESSKLNEKFGKLFSQSGDYQLLGYALYLYGNRVYKSFKETRGMRNNAKPAEQTHANTGSAATEFAGTYSQNGYNRGANLPYSSSGPRRLA